MAVTVLRGCRKCTFEKENKPHQEQNPIPTSSLKIGETYGMLAPAGGAAKAYWSGAPGAGRALKITKYKHQNTGNDPNEVRGLFTNLRQ